MSCVGSGGHIFHKSIHRLRCNLRPGAIDPPLCCEGVVRLNRRIVERIDNEFRRSLPRLMGRQQNEDAAFRGKTVEWCFGKTTTRDPFAELQLSSSEVVRISARAAAHPPDKWKTQREVKMASVAGIVPLSALVVSGFRPATASLGGHVKKLAIRSEVPL